MADAFQMFKYVYSTILLAFALVLILGVVFTRQTHLSKDVHPALAIVVLVITISWLTMVEGGQGALVGLTPVDPILYEKTHKWTRMCTKLVYTGDNLDRYLLGRQFMVILIVFSVEMAGAATEYKELWGLPSWLSNIFLVSGLAMILFTCMVGQLNSEINGCHFNNWLGIVTVWVALAIEFSGLLHFTYIIQQVVSALAGKPIVSNEPPRNFFQQIFFYGRCLFSLGALIFAFTIVLGALFQGKSKMWDSVPPTVSVIIFFVLLFIIGQLEASQIAYFAVTKLRECERGDAMFAKLTCDVIFKGDGRNLQAFIIGRQLCVVSCMFFVARITSIRLEEGDPNILGVPDWVQAIVDTGLLGALCVAIIGSMMWRLLAASFPIFFLSFPVTYILLRWCMILEYTGIMHGAWVLAALHKKIAGFQRDEVYIGTAEDRAAMKKCDSQVVTGPGHVTSVPELLANPLDFTEDRSLILANIKTLHVLMGMSTISEVEKQIYQLSLAQEVAHLERFNKEHGKNLTASKHGTDPVVATVEKMHDLAMGMSRSDDYC